MFILKFLVLLCIGVEKSGGKLLMLSLVHRHGERMPVTFYPNDPHQHDNWPRAVGQLTNEGKRQEHELGKYIRQTYDSIIGKRYFSNITYYRSTDVDRTLMSAQLVSAGIFKPHGKDIWNDELLWQPVPIHTESLANDHLLSGSASCPEFMRLYAEALKVPPLSTFVEKYQGLFDFMSKYAGMKVSITNFWEIYDDVSKEIARNMTEPDWVLKVWSKVVTMTNREFGLLVPSRQMQRLRGGPFLKELITNCKAKAAGKFVRNLMMYSAHDTTLSILLDSLDVYNGLQPPYASVILFEFHHTGTSSTHYKDFAIKVLYRNSSKTDPHPLLIPGCDAILCPFDKFLEVVGPIIPVDIVKECTSTVIEPDIFNMKFLFYIVLGFLLLEILGLIALFCFARHRKVTGGFQVLNNEID